MGNEKCKACAEPTKYVAGLWDGRDDNGKHIGGPMFACESQTCEIAVEGKKTMERLFAAAERIREENYRNTVDVGKLRQKRIDRHVSQRKAANMLNVKLDQYSRWEYGAEAFPIWAYTKLDEKLDKMEGENETE